MAFDVNAFKGALKLGGARPSLFQVNITNPVNGAADIQIPFLCKAASIPASTLSQVIQNYFGRPVKFPGNRTFEDWTVQIINDEDFAIRNTLEQWSNAINSHEGNIRDLAASVPTLYKSDAQVTQFSQTGAPLRVYNFVGLWPTNISEIELSWDNTDQIEEYQVTFSYDYYEVTGGLTGLGGL